MHIMQRFSLLKISLLADNLLRETLMRLEDIYCGDVDVILRKRSETQILIMSTFGIGMLITLPLEQLDLVSGRLELRR
jgi:hypothetical protein